MASLIGIAVIFAVGLAASFATGKTVSINTINPRLPTVRVVRRAEEPNLYWMVTIVWGLLTLIAGSTAFDFLGFRLP